MQPINHGKGERRKFSPSRNSAASAQTPLINQRELLLVALQHYLSNVGEGEQCGLIIIDIRDFRLLNRSFGTQLADNVLAMIAARLNGLDKSLFEHYYLGNDEFGIILPKLARAGVALLLAEQLLQLFKDVFVLDEHTLKITVNAGISLSDTEVSEQKKMGNATALAQLYDAEEALLLAKEHNQPYRLYAENRAKPQPLQWQLLNDLHVAMRNDEMSLYYQPKIALADHHREPASNVSKKNCYAEALVRWQTQSHGLITPNVTIPLIEHLGSEADLIRWLLHSALKQLTEADANSTLCHHVSINVPATTITTPQLHTDLTQALSLWDIDPSRLTLEITEDVLIDDKEQAFDHLSKIRETGVKIAIDDFGTGYSSLAYFKHIPADEIKIDQAFIRGMRDNDSDRILVKWIIELAHAFNLIAVAEGVEDQQTLDLLKQMHCDYAQGYVFSRPLPFNEYAKWLSDFQS